MQHVVPFAAIKQGLVFVSVGGTLKTELSYQGFMDLLRKLLAGVAVDEAWYRESYPDVAEAIAAGVYPSASSHFIEHGYFEGRRPFAAQVLEDWYLEANPDVRHGIEAGDLISAQDHFNRHGYDEGRQPAPS